MRRPSQRAGRGWKALLESREGLGGIGSPCRRAGRIGRSCHGPGGVLRPSWRDRWCLKAHPEDREG